MLSYPIRFDASALSSSSVGGRVSPKSASLSRFDAGPVADTARLCWWSTIKSSMRILHRIDVHGREHVPESGPFVLVANHASHLDALALGSVLPLAHRNRLSPLAAGDVFFEKPAVAAFATTVLNARPVWRTNCGAQALKDLRRGIVESSGIYILFPEGGRTRDGRMLPFKPGVGMLVAGTEVPVIPCHVSGTFEALPAGAVLPRPSRITLRIGSPRVFNALPNRRTGWEAVTSTLERDIMELGEGCG